MRERYLIEIAESFKKMFPLRVFRYISLKNILEYNFQLKHRDTRDLVLAHLFITVPRPGDREVTFSVFTLLPVTTSHLSFHYPFFTLNVKQGSCEYQLLKSFDLTRSEIEPRSTDYEANALITRSRVIKYTSSLSLTTAEEIELLTFDLKESNVKPTYHKPLVNRA